MYKQILSSLTANRSVPWMYLYLVPWNLSIQGFIPRLLAVSINGEIAQIPPRGGQLRQWCLAEAYNRTVTAITAVTSAVKLRNWQTNPPQTHCRQFEHMLTLYWVATIHTK